MITAQGLEGGAIYALSALLRATLEREGKAEITIDLRPDMPLDALARRLQMPRANRSFSASLRKANFSPLAIALLHEGIKHPTLAQMTPETLAARVKADSPAPSPPLAALSARRLMRISCCAPGRAFSLRAKCLTGKLRPAAISCKPVSAPLSPQRKDYYYILKIFRIKLLNNQ
jgi:hypothetical protein